MTWSRSTEVVSSPGRPIHFDARQNSRRRSLRPSTKTRPGTGKVASAAAVGGPRATRRGHEELLAVVQVGPERGGVLIGPPIHAAAP